MEQDRAPGKRAAALTSALFAAKGDATAQGFAAQPSAAPEPAAARHAGPAAREKILIVEDNELNMKILRDLLILRGYTVLQAADGAEALALARDHRPDLVLMDLRLPGTSGLEVARRLKSDGSLGAIKVIAVTAYSREWDEAAVRDAGCDGYLAKPVPVSSLHQTVARALG